MISIYPLAPHPALSMRPCFGSGTEYDVEVSGMTGVGTVRASINAGVASDATGNPNTASTSTDNTVMFINSPFSIYLPITVR